MVFLISALFFLYRNAFANNSEQVNLVAGL